MKAAIRLVAPTRDDSFVAEAASRWPSWKALSYLLTHEATACRPKLVQAIEIDVNDSDTRLTRAEWQSRLPGWQVLDSASGGYLLVPPGGAGREHEREER